MEKLIKPVEYAQYLGISRQAVYAKIKRGILESKSVDGKLYIVVDEKSHPGEEESGAESGEKSSGSKSPVPQQVDYETLLRAKDETIGVLKDTVKDLKESNVQMSTTLRGEIDLLKEAFYEMRTLYVRQIEQIRKPDEALVLSGPIDVPAVEQKKDQWITLKKFFKKREIFRRKKQESVAKKLKKAFKRGDERIRSENGELRVRKREQFVDILG